MQVKGGYNGFSWYQDAIPSNDVPFHNTPFIVPTFQFPNLSIGGQPNYPNDTWQNTYSSRLDVNWHLGQHETKFGGEFLRVRDTKDWDLNRRGTYVFNKQPSTADARGRLPGRRLEQPGGLEHQQPRAVSAGVRCQLQSRLQGRHAAAHAGPLVRRQLAHHQQPDRQSRRPLRRGLGRDAIRRGSRPT